MLTKEQIQKEIEEMDAYIPVKKIEENLGMPPTTLQKVLKGERKLPKKWHKILEAYFVRKPETAPKPPTDSNKPQQAPKPEKAASSTKNENSGELSSFERMRRKKMGL